MSDTKLIVYGARCVWWDSPEKAGQSTDDMPCCPHCKSVLLQQPEEQWIQAATDHDKRAPGYLRFVLWLKSKCYPNWGAAQLAHDQEMDSKLLETKTWQST